MMADASALVAILAGEPEGSHLLERLYKASSRTTHAISVYEASIAIARLNEIPHETARDDVGEFLTAMKMDFVPIEGAISSAALEAFARYGKGRHPAALNMGDCFSYACAKQHGMPLLYKGDDFALTDLA